MFEPPDLAAIDHLFVRGQFLLQTFPTDCNMGDSDLTYDLMLACMSPIEAQKHRAKLLEPSSKQDALHLQAGGAKGLQVADAKNSHVGHLELVNRGE